VAPQRTFHALIPPIQTHLLGLGSCPASEFESKTFRPKTRQKDSQKDFQKDSQNIRNAQNSRNARNTANTACIGSGRAVKASQRAV
jgi:hypothetical protein